MNLRARNLRVGWLLAVVAMVAFAAAGRWQLGRMHEKEAMLAAADAALAQGEPQPLLLASDPGRSSAYDRARGTGRIANATVWLDSQMREGRSGVRMYCVLFPDEGVQPILVDAGWWPLTAAAPCRCSDAPPAMRKRCAACWRHRRRPASPMANRWRRMAMRAGWPHAWTCPPSRLP